MMDNWWLRRRGKLGYMWIMRVNRVIRGVIRGN
jgi:hypothetical protein